MGESSREKQACDRLMAIRIGEVYVVRCVDAGQDEWRRLKVVGQVPSPPGEPPTEWAVQIAGVELETRNVLGTTLRDECDLEPA
jgi:hypothetical protein